jgi:hypothetical protein
MKFVFIVHTEHNTARVMQIFDTVGIDYYTRWDNATGKGHGTEPHLGRGSFASTNSVMMVAFQDEAPLEALVRAITAANSEIKRAADRIRLFQLPLERMV